MGLLFSFKLILAFKIACHLLKYRSGLLVGDNMCLEGVNSSLYCLATNCRRVPIMVR